MLGGISIEYVDIVIPTGLGLARNVLVVKSADIVVALPGEAGTLSEIAYCLQFGIPVISLMPLASINADTALSKVVTGWISTGVPSAIAIALNLS